MKILSIDEKTKTARVRRTDMSELTVTVPEMPELPEIGSVVTVKFDAYTADGSLLNPQILRIRPDIKWFYFMVTRYS
jgi:ATP-dependent DNA ligase